MYNAPAETAAAAHDKSFLILYCMPSPFLVIYMAIPLRGMQLMPMPMAAETIGRE
jgi:hypothetical protein